MNSIKDVQIGDVFSEVNYFTVQALNPNGTVYLKHHATKETVTVSNEYLEKFLSSADQYQGEEVKVGIEDKLWTAKQIADTKRTDVQVGDLRVPGLKTIWDSIGQSVFCVEFTKKATPLSKKAYDLAVQAKMDEVAEAIEKAQRNKKGVGNVAKEEVLKLINNPILNHIPGEVRTMRAYKLQHTSTDGQYAVMDMDKGEKRSVNLPTVSCIVVNGVKYIKE
jgi:hypothetical protein